MTVSSERVLIIGLDAATLDLIRPWAQAGFLPHMARLLERGTHGPLRSVPNLNSLAAWTTFMTGKNPGRHGVYWFYEHQAGTYDLRFMNGSDIQAPRFWEIASDAGRRVGVINVPMTYPARPLNGVLVAGMDAPDESSPGFTYPADLYEELQGVGDYLIDTNILGYARSGRKEQALAVTRWVIDERAKAAEHLMRTRPWDLFAVIFTALDRIQHGFWADNVHEASLDAPPHQAVSGVVRDFYQHLDRVVGRLCELAGPETTVIILSDHGMGVNPQSNLYLVPWLESLGLFQRHDQEDGWMSAAMDRLLRGASALADGLLSKRMRRRILRWLPGGRSGLVSRLHKVPCDWSQTKVYTDYIQPSLWINLRGREPEGIVSPGAEYEALRDLLIEQLESCRDSGTGRPIVRGVYRREEVYTGPYVDRAPDLHIDWNYDLPPVAGYRYQDERSKMVTVGTPAEVVERRNVSGDHRPEGTLIMAGPPVRPGHQVTEAALADVAPTVLHLLGLPLPADLDGGVITEALAPEYAKSHPVRHGKSTDASASPERAFSAEEAQQVEDRLRGLGYLD
jgi:predicted AlkP superfamily phosphohydrolase/phosphomutase